MKALKADEITIANNLSQLYGQKHVNGQASFSIGHSPGGIFFVYKDEGQKTVLKNQSVAIRMEEVSRGFFYSG